MEKQTEAETIRRVVEQRYLCKVTALNEIGRGATGGVYRVKLEKEPFQMAVKAAKNYELLEEEYRYIRFISDRVDMKLPKLYFLHKAADGQQAHLLGMQFFDGVSAENPKFRWKSRKAKARFAAGVADNLERLQKVTNDRFGPIDNAVYDDWHAYYRPFAKKVLDAAEDAYSKGNFVRGVLDVMRTAYEHYDEVFSEPVGTPVLTHGDYWTPNMLVDRRTMELVGVVDPFHVMWAERDYELFTLTAGMGKKFHLYETCKKRMGLSDRCDLKNEFYALFSEVFWFTRTGHKLDRFLKYKARLLKKQLKRFAIL